MSRIVLSNLPPILSFRCNSLQFFPNNSHFNRKIKVAFTQRKSYVAQFTSPVVDDLVERVGSSLEEKDASCSSRDFGDLPHVQTLSAFPVEELVGKVLMVRFDSVILNHGENALAPPDRAFSTIKYLYEAGAKVVLVSSWSEKYSSTESVADFLSSMVDIRVVPVKFIPNFMHSGVGDKNSEIILLENLSGFKGEVSNCAKFSKELASGVDMIVNDAFSQAHKILASTVGVACFCYACVAGFYFEEELNKMKKIFRTSEKPYMAIIGGGNFAEKASALRVLASVCDGLVFVGSMAFQIMYAQGVSVPMKLVEPGALKEAAYLVQFAKSRSIRIVLPVDVWCINNQSPEQMEILSADSIIEGWQPVDIGPRSLQEMTDLLLECKKITWIGPLRFGLSRKDGCGTVELAKALGTFGQSGCDINFIGKMDFDAQLQKPLSFSNVSFVKNAVVAWEALKGRKLPGLMTLDRAYPTRINWTRAYADPTRPLVVDVGSGNGLFVFGMAKKSNDMNFLGLEMNAKLVDRCLGNIGEFGVQNVDFIATNATSTFRSIVSSYPGELVLVSIQCPNPDFNKPEHRWRMLQRSLVEAIADTLIFGGKVFIQSDIEAVALRMKTELMKYGKGLLELVDCSEGNTITGNEWLKANPFGVPSDWERHVLDRGDPMYRLLLGKVIKEVMVKSI